MKNITKLLLIAAASASWNIRGNAGEPLLTPRAMGNQTVVVSGHSNDPDLVRGQNDLGEAARAKASGNPSMVAVSSRDRDLTRDRFARVGSPRGLDQLRGSGREFQIAPLK